MLISFQLLIFVATMSADTTVVVGQPAAAPAGGPAVWYDVETVANTHTDGGSAVDATEWSAVTVGVAGTATKARMYFVNSLGSGNFKMALYNASGTTVLASGSGTHTAADDSVYVEITFTTPVAVTATSYLIAWSFDNGNVFPRYKASSGSWNAKLSQSYASFPFTPIGTPDFTFSRGYAVSVYVD